MSLVTEAQMRGILLVEEAGLDETQMAVWEQFRIELEVWKAPQDGDFGFGFWAVALSGDQVMWFNSLANAFVVAPFGQHGHIPPGEHVRRSMGDCLERLAP